MPDIKTALQTALQAKPATIPAEWDDEGKPTPIVEAQTPKQEDKENNMPNHLFAVTNNVSRATYEFLRDNPGSPRTKAMEGLVTQGFNPRSVSALLSQMLAQGLLRGDTQTGLFVAHDTYQPVKSYKSFRKLQDDKAAKRAAKKAAKQPKQSAPPVQDKAQPTLEEKKAALYGPGNPVAKSVWDAQAALSGLSVLQARELYDALRKIFGN